MLLPPCYHPVCYHPPKPRYSPPELIAAFQDTLNELLVAYPPDVFVSTGDLNQLRYHCFLVDFGLSVSQIVTVPTTNCNVGIECIFNLTPRFV